MRFWAAAMVRPSTARTSRAGSTSWPTPAAAPFTVTRPSATSCSALRRDATPASASALWMRTSLNEALRRFCVERRQIVERRDAETLEEIEPGAVQDWSAGRIGTALLDHEPAVQQRPQHVVRVDAADALDRASRHWLSVGNDRQRLERRGRQLDALGSGVSRDQRAGFRRRDELHFVAGGHKPEAALAECHFEIAEQRVERFAIDTRERGQRAPRQWPLGDEQERFQMGRGDARALISRAVGPDRDGDESVIH